MKLNFYFIACCIAFCCISPAKAQTYIFDTVNSPASCGSTYQINITTHLDSFKVTNIYFDDGVTGSFAFEGYVSYQNTFTNSTLPPGNFFTYQMSVFSDNTNLSPNSLTNDIVNVPLVTSTAGGLASQNNPTYTGSASAMGLVLGGVYSDLATLTILGYDSATLHINLPCLDTLLETNSTGPGPLPVLWSVVTAAVNGKEVSLSWQTYMEQYNRGFAVEKSLDGTIWQRAGFINSKAPGGNSSVPLSYQYKQTEQSAGRYFYRVIQQDLDGKSVVSNVVSISITGQQHANDLIVYPNPAVDAIYLQQIPSDAQYIISDSYGRIVLRGSYQGRIDITKLSPGMYWIRTGTKVSRFIVTKGY